MDKAGELKVLRMTAFMHSFDCPNLNHNPTSGNYRVSVLRAREGGTDLEILECVVDGVEEEHSERYENSAEALQFFSRSEKTRQHI